MKNHTKYIQDETIRLFQYQAHTKQLYNRTFMTLVYNKLTHTQNPPLIGQLNNLWASRQLLTTGKTTIKQTHQVAEPKLKKLGYVLLLLYHTHKIAAENKK